MDKIAVAIMAVIGILVFSAAVALLLVFPVMWAINWLFAPSVLVALFGVAKLTFWKTFVLEFITSTLFKSYNYSSGK